jgi:hypothetical protein
MTTLTGGEAAPRREKRGDDVSCVDTNFTGLKNEKKSHDQFSWYKYTVKI